MRPSRGLSSGSKGSAGLGRFLQNYDSMMDSLSSMSFDSNKLFPDRVPQKVSPNRPHRRSTSTSRQSRDHGVERTISTKAVCLQIDVPKRSKAGRGLVHTTSAETKTMKFDSCFERSNSFSSLEDSMLLERKRSCVRTNSSSLGDLFQGAPQDDIGYHSKTMKKPITKTNSSSLSDLFQPAPRDFDSWQEEVVPARRRPVVRRNSSSSLGDLVGKKAPPRRSCMRTRSSSLGDLFQVAPRDFDAW